MSDPMCVSSTIFALQVLATAFAGAGSPQVTSLLPVGGTRGTTVRLTFVGDRLDAAQDVAFYGAGLSIQKISNVDGRTVTADCAIAADCTLGEHALRLRTASGWSDIVTFSVSALPTIAEAEDNGDMAAAQRIAVDTTVDGVITSEDVDWYVFDLKAGERLTAEIEAMRLGRAFFDPAIAIVDAGRFELAVSDDTALLAQDSIASIVAPKDGTYYVVVREAAYGGSDGARYRLHVGRFPRPLAAWPPAAAPGLATTIAWRGEPVETPPCEIAIPADARGIAPVFARDGERTAPSPNRVVISALHVVDESSAAATISAVPIALHGTIAAAGEEDRWKVRVRKGVTVVLRVLAQRLGSPLDAMVVALDAAGKEVGTLDDTVGTDPELRATPEEDAEFELRIRDHRRRGGPTFTYRIELAPPVPALEVSIERVDSQRPQFLQAIAVPRGASMAAIVRAERVDVAGDVSISFPSLPPGILADPVVIPADRTSVPVVFRAAADAPPAGALVKVDAACNAERGQFRQAVPLVRAAPNETVYYETSVDRLAVAVTEAAPFRVAIVAPQVPLARQGVKDLAVRVERDEGFTGDVTVHMLLNPPGVTSPGAVTIPAASGEGMMRLNASGDAALGTHRIALLAHAPVGGGDVWLSTDFVDLVVAEPFYTGTLQMAAGETGTTAKLACSLRSVRPFDGEATVTLLGLPPNATAAPLVVKAGATEVIFDVVIAADAPLGQHRGLQCDLALAANGETVAHRVAFDGMLRIDAPSTPTPTPAPTPAPTVTAAPEPAAVAAPLPLSRLEQLRRAAKGETTRKAGGS